MRHVRRLRSGALFDASDVHNKFAEGGGVGFDEGEVSVGGDGETDGADAGVEVEDFVGVDVGFNFLEGEFVNGEVDLEEAVGGVRVGFFEDFVFEVREDGVGLVVFEETAGDDSLLVAAKEEGLVCAGFSAL